MKTIPNRLKLFSAAMMLLLTAVTGCKKNSASTTPDPTPETPVAKMTGKIDGKDITIGAANLTTTYYTSPGDNVSSLSTSAALDGSGNKLNFFINDLKSGTINISPKLGTNSNPGNPNLKINDTNSPAVQTYVQYYNAGNTYYALSGFVKIEIDNAKGITVTWEINFKDAAGRTFSSSGSFFLPVATYTANTKAKTEVVDPTPVAAKPTVESVAPTTGMATDTVAIAGTNFSTVTTEDVVKFNNVDAKVISATATKIMAVVPTSTTGTITVKVKNSETTTGPTFTYVQAPTFTAMSPATGKAGDVITLTGTNFSTTLTENVVAFNGVIATVKTATATTLTVEAPQNVATGVVTIKVRNKAASLAQGFTAIFTLAVVTTPIINVGTPGQSYELKGSYSAFVKATDNDGNIYVVDENQQLYKKSPSGDVLKTFTKNDITFKAMNSYKCVAITSNKKGAVRALFYCPTFPNGQLEVYMVAIGTSGTISKEFQTTLYDTDFAGMVWDNTDYYLLSSHFNTDDIIKLKSADGTFTQYLKGGANGDFGGSSPYSMDLDGSNNLFVLSYVKGQFTTSIPTNQAIYKFDANKAKTTILASYTDGYADGALATAKFKDIRSIVVSNLDIFVGDNGNYRIRKIATRDNTVTTIAGNGKATEPTNNNQPIYSGGLLNINLRGSNGLMLNTFSNALYNFSSGQPSFQKFVLN